MYFSLLVILTVYRNVRMHRLGSTAARIKTNNEPKYESVAADMTFTNRAAFLYAYIESVCSRARANATCCVVVASATTVLASIVAVPLLESVVISTLDRRSSVYSSRNRNMTTDSLTAAASSTLPFTFVQKCRLLTKVLAIERVSLIVSVLFACLVTYTSPSMPRES